MNVSACFRWYNSAKSRGDGYFIVILLLTAEEHPSVTFFDKKAIKASFLIDAFTPCRYCCSLSEKMSEDPRFDPQSYQQDLSFEDKYDIYVDSNNDDLTVEQGGVGFWKYLLAFSLTLSVTAISFYFFGAAIWMVSILCIALLKTLILEVLFSWGNYYL